ncbi:Pyrimidine-nucleoside phosphorylase [bioreactor metagenome]|uniref:Pyrimidine-nucleoside phosphorylase n=1 Tax=bioreactor metagenome TaxID=1076179 RepID=A0A645D8G4_9ZZZZ
MQGNGPEDLIEMCYVLGSQMVVLAKKADSVEEARVMLQEALTSGKALEKFKEMIQNQGGDIRVVEKPELLLTARYQVELPAKSAGLVSKIVANELGIAAMMLGAGRKTKEDAIDHAVGLKLHKKIGDSVQEGESLLTIYSNTEDLSQVVELLYQNIEISDSAKKPILVHDIITE